MKKKIYKIIIVFFVTILALTTVSFAQEKLYLAEKTEQYKQWESLSNQTKENAIEPRAYSISIEDSMLRSKYLNLLAETTYLPTNFYDYLSENYKTTIKDQKATGSCWAFSVTSMLENNVAVGRSLLGQVYSPFHMDYVTYKMYNRTLGYGGNVGLAIAYMVNGNGPVLESDFVAANGNVYDEVANANRPYYLTDPSKVNLNQTSKLKINQTVEFPSIYKYKSGSTITYHDGNGTTYTTANVETFRKNIKTHIMNYGAVTAVMYVDIAINANNGQFVSNYYDSETNIFCCTRNNDYSSTPEHCSNHQVTIVGWDDSIRAYIVQNSYGEAFGDGGYFYVSYDDLHIEEWIYGITDLEQLTSDSYDKIYIHDELGMNNAIGNGSTSVYYANVFDRTGYTNDKDEYINEVGLYLYNTTGIDIYVNTQDGNINGTFELVSSGNTLESGYHVIKLNASDATKLTGDKFVIKVKATNQEGAFIPLEMDLSASRFTSTSSYDKATGNVGESVLSFDGTSWMDINQISIYDQNNNVHAVKETNICVRAFTKYVDKVKDVQVTGVTLDKTSVVLTEGETEELTANIFPADATNQNVIWSSSNEAIATVENGVITAKIPGKTTITVTTENGGFTANCEVTVEEKVINTIGVTLNQNAVEIEEEQTVTLTATVLPENATNKNITWSSSNINVATVSNGVITAVKAGTATITVTTAEGGWTASCQVTVKAKVINVTEVTLSQNTVEIEQEQTVTLTATVLPENATNKNVTWSSSNENVATVSNGVITAVSAGTATIRVTTLDGNHTAICQVTVKEAKPTVINVTGITLNKTSETLKIGETSALEPTISPADATNQNITWSSSNARVATVSNGVVNAVGEGTAKISVVTEDGNYTAICEVTVEKPVINVTGVTLDKSDETLKIGKTITLTPKITPADATDKNITWSSSNAAVAKVENGVVTALKEGTATITVKTVDGNYKANCKITVEKNVIKVTGVEYKVKSYTIKEGFTINLLEVVEILPSNATNKNITFESSNSEVATVSNGVVTAVKAGTSTITVKTEEGNYTDKCTITVEENKSEEVKVESIEIDKQELKMQVAERATLVITFNPKLPTNTKITWKSSNTKVAMVDENGIVTAVGKGNAVITATSEDGGYTAKCTITVTKQVEDPDDIYKQPDPTITDQQIPNAGITTIMSMATIIILIAILFNFIKIKKMKDVK